MNVGPEELGGLGDIHAKIKHYMAGGNDMITAGDKVGTPHRTVSYAHAELSNRSGDWTEIEV
jgi:hypothetical protein